MDFDLINSATRKIRVTDIIVQFFIVTILNIAVISSLAFSIWPMNVNLFHTVFELLCLFIALSTFFIAWYNFSNGSMKSYLLALGFLSVAVFDAFHIYFYAVDYDLSTKYWVIGRFIEAIALLIACSQIKKLDFNRWLGLIFTIIATFGISQLLISARDFIPLMIDESYSTPFKFVSTGLIIVILFVALFSLRKKLNMKDELTYRYIYLAVIFAIASEICFLSFTDSGSVLNLACHTFKISYYFFLFNGIFVSSVKYPYEKLEEERHYMTEILNSLPIGLTTYDQNLVLSFTNKKGSELLSASDNETTNASAENLIEKFCGLRKTDKNLVRLASEKANSITNKVITVTNGAEGTLKLVVNVLKLKEKGFICLFDEAKKEQELENLRLQTQTILNCLSNTVSIMDKNRRIIMCNKAFEEIFCKLSRDVLGMEVDSFNKMMQMERKASAPLSMNPENEMYEVSMIVPKGDKKDMILQPANIYNVDGEIIGYISVGTDITDLKKEQEKLQHKDKLALLGQMSAAIVHETKNLLASIKGYCQLIILKEKDEQIKKYVSRIDSMTNDVNKVMVDFLDMAKPRTPVLIPVSVNELIKSMEFMLSSSSLIKGVDISIILTPDERLVLCDEAQLKQVILNMVKNSIESMGNSENPVLIIKTGYEEDRHEMNVAICDNGKGISKEDRAKIGSPFFTTKKNGTGLGLNVCYQIIREHNGRIDLESDLTKGTTFKVVFPATDATQLPSNDIE